MTVREALDLFASFYDEPGATRAELIDDLGLADKRDTAYRQAVGRPEAAAVDRARARRPARRSRSSTSSSTGLDPQARRDTWQLIESIRDRGVTVLLVTHLMEEAERLADRVAVIDDGRVVAARHARRASSRWSTRSSGSGSGRPSRSRTRLLTDLPEVRRVERTRPDRRRHRHRQPHQRGDGRPRPPPDRRQRPADRAGQPRRRVPRPHRPPARPAPPRSCHERAASAHRHRGQAVLPRARSRGSRRSPCRRSSCSIFGSIFGPTEPDPALGGRRFIDVFVPSLVVITLGTLGHPDRCRSASRRTARRASCAGCRRRRPTRSGCWPRSSSIYMVDCGHRPGPAGRRRERRVRRPAPAAPARLRRRVPARAWRRCSRSASWSPRVAPSTGWRRPSRSRCSSS